MSDINKRMEYYDLRKNYVEGLRTALAPIRSFDNIEYMKRTLTGEEFVKISDLLGASMFLDVTGMERAEILKDVCRVVLMDDVNDSAIIPHGFITDDDKRLGVAELFRR